MLQFISGRLNQFLKLVFYFYVQFVTEKVVMTFENCPSGFSGNRVIPFIQFNTIDAFI
jgi:hypothetical protein